MEQNRIDLIRTEKNNIDLVQNRLEYKGIKKRKGSTEKREGTEQNRMEFLEQ